MQIPSNIAVQMMSSSVATAAHQDLLTRRPDLRQAEQLAAERAAAPVRQSRLPLPTNSIDILV